VLLLIAAVSLIWPLVVAVPLATIAMWIAVSSLVRARELRAAQPLESAAGTDPRDGVKGD
jgi:hypothetical protein